MSDFNLGTVTAYGYAKDKGYTGTEEEFAELMASYASVAESAAASAESAAASATTATTKAGEASTSASNAATSATTASTAATTATTKAGEASTSASTASTKASEATTAAATATTKAGEASTSATNAAESATTASTAATTATTKASEAAASATAAAQSAASLVIDDTLTHAGQAADAKKVGDEISSLKEDFSDVKSAIAYDYNSIVDTSEFLNFLTTTFDITGKVTVDNLGRDYVTMTANSANSYVFIPVAVKAGTIEVKFVFTAGENINLRIYKPDKSTLLFNGNLASGSTYNFIIPSDATYYLRVYFVSANTTFALTSTTMKLVGTTDQINSDLVDAPVFNASKEIVVNEMLSYDDGKIVVPVRWEQGSLDATGSPAVSAARVRDSQYEAVMTDMYVIIPSGLKGRIYYYDSTYAFNENTEDAVNVLTIDTSKGEFFKVVIGKTSNGNIVPDEAANVIVYKSSGIFNYVDTISPNWTAGGINGNGTINTAANQYHSDKILVRKGQTLTIGNGELILVLKTYNSEPIVGTSVPDGSTGSIYSYTATSDIWCVLVGITTATPGLLSENAIIHTNIIDDINRLYGADTQRTEVIKYVTQTDIINSVQKEVIETEVTTVDSPRNAANAGVLPSNSGATNYTNLQALLNSGGTIIIDTPGTYEVEGQLTIGSNTELIFGEQVYMKKTSNTGGFLINAGASTKVYNTNIRIDGLKLLCNGTTGSTMTTVPGLRGEIGLYYAKNVVISNFECLDLPDQVSYCIHISNWERVLIDNAHIEGDKDGIHVSRGKHLTIRRCRFSTKDDPIALNAYDYRTGCPEVGWIEDVLIEDCVDYNDNRTTQRSILVLGAAWSDWSMGNEYRNGDTVVNSDGYVYRFCAPVIDKTLYTSTVEPSVTSGYETCSDGLTWYCCQADSQYNAIVRNVTIRNCFFGKGRTNIIIFLNEDSAYIRSVYPGAGVVPHSNITVDSATVSDDITVTNFAEIQMPIDMLRIINSRFAADNIITSAKNWTTTEDNNKVAVVVANNLLSLNSGKTSMGCINSAAGYEFTLSAYGNSKHGGFTMANTGDVETVLNDLT